MQIFARLGEKPIRIEICEKIYIQKSQWKIDFLLFFSPIFQDLCHFIQLWKITPFSPTIFSVSGGGALPPMRAPLVIGDIFHDQSRVLTRNINLFLCLVPVYKVGGQGRQEWPGKPPVSGSSLGGPTVENALKFVENYVLKCSLKFSKIEQL